MAATPQLKWLLFLAVFDLLGGQPSSPPTQLALAHKIL